MLDLTFDNNLLVAFGLMIRVADNDYNQGETSQIVFVALSSLRPFNA